ncbi:MAG: ATP-binding protein, partial [Lachnospiraceae bacterium]
MKSARKLILYREFEEGRIFEDFTWIMEHYNSEYYNKEDIQALCYECFHHLIELSASHGFEGNLWQNYLTLLLVNNENAYSTSCEIRGSVSGSINDLAFYDFTIFKELFDFDFYILAEQLDIPELCVLRHYKRANRSGNVFNHRIRDRICELSIRLAQTMTVEEFKDEVTTFYKEFGVGNLGLHKAFRVEHKGEEVKITPITNIAHVHLDDLVGYEIAKQKLIDNTEAFVNGKQANNCLLFGDAGTGKSTSIKAIINQYYEQGLRMIEVYKHQFQDLNSVITQIKNRN